MRKIVRQIGIMIAGTILHASPAVAQTQGDDVWVEHILASREALKAYFDRFKTHREEETSYQLLFQAWHQMSPLPYGRDGLPLITARTLHPDERVWPDIKRWASSPAHDEVFELVLQAGELTEDEDDEMRVERVFGLPHGLDAVEQDMIDADFVAADDMISLLNGEAFLYLAAIEDLRKLVFADAYRRGEEGETMEAMRLLMAWVAVGRQIADRDFEVEKAYGMWTMIETTCIMRNILYRHQTDLEVAEYREIVDGLNGLFLERIRFPSGDKRALLSLAGDTYERRGGPDREAFIDAFTAIESLPTPLTRFQVRKRWEQIAESHAGYFDTVDELNRLWGDLDFRWNTEDPFDLSISGPTYLERMSAEDLRSYQIVVMLLGSLADLEDLRKQLQISIGGTQASLAVLSYQEMNKELPLNVVNITPRHVDEIPFDPYDNRRQRNRRQLQYFVPVRDYPPVAARELPEPYPVQLHTPIGNSPLIYMNDSNKFDDFLIYSKGENLRNDFMHEDDLAIGDVMVWPPLEELLRGRELWP